MANPNQQLARAVHELATTGRLTDDSTDALNELLEDTDRPTGDVALEDDGPDDTAPVDYDAFTVDELRDEAERRGLVKSGNKGELGDRLAADDRENQR